MWGSSIIGFGNKRYKSPTSGREVDWFIIGFSPRKANITIYLIDMRPHADALVKLGKHKMGGGCLYINKLADVDIKVLEKMIAAAAKQNFSSPFSDSARFYPLEILSTTAKAHKIKTYKLTSNGTGAILRYTTYYSPRSSINLPGGRNPLAYVIILNINPVQLFCLLSLLLNWH